MNHKVCQTSHYQHGISKTRNNYHPSFLYHKVNLELAINQDSRKHGDDQRKRNHQDKALDEGQQAIGQDPHRYLGSYHSICFMVSIGA